MSTVDGLPVCDCGALISNWQVRCPECRSSFYELLNARNDGLDKMYADAIFDELARDTVRRTYDVRTQ